MVSKTRQATESYHSEHGKGIGRGDVKCRTYSSLSSKTDFQMSYQPLNRLFLTPVHIMSF